MTWTDPLGDLRLLLNDDVAGNLAKSKQVFPSRGGEADGTNSIFYTFEDRLVAPAGNQAGQSPPKLRVFLGSPNNQTQAVTEVAASGITVTDPVRGEFQLTIQPSGVMVTASYYWEQFLDTDLNFALTQAAKQVNVTTIDQTPDGLQLAALNIAASLAHRKAAQRWMFRKSMQFLLEDAPAQDAVDAAVKFHTEQATLLWTDGLLVRHEFYNMRQDQGYAPASAILARTPRPWTPNR